MATIPNEKEKPAAGRLTPEAQQYVIKYCSALLEKKKQFNEFQNKMDAIDIAYARYQEMKNKIGKDGADLHSSSQIGCDIFAEDDVVPPVVVAEVDTHVAYLADVFLSGSPMFPVVSTPSKRKWAEQLETLLDDHAQLGGYARQLLLFLRDGVKYNFCCLEAPWDEIDQFSVLDDIRNPTGQKIDRKPKKFTRIQRIDPRNAIWDWNTAPGDIAEKGDYAGYVEQISQTKLKTLLNKLTKSEKMYNAKRAIEHAGINSNAYTPHFKEAPQISDYINGRAGDGRYGIDWDSWFDPSARNKGLPKGLMYEKMVIYARIMPSDFKIDAPQKNTPQIWKFVIINNAVMIQAERIISAFDYLPLLFGQPLEDGLGYQTQSIAEGAIPFQKAANTLFNIRFAAARRSVSDRALYLPDMIKPSDVNSKNPAPKIPVAISALSPRGINEAYYPIPFSMQGTETAIQDAATIVSFAKELHGSNAPRQGQFQKGNKSVQEWNDTMGGSEGRMRMPALVLEHQVFSPLKSILALNIFQYGEDTVVTSQVSGKQLDVKIDELRKVVMSFKIADGYTPKSKIASTEIILAGMNMIQQSPLLQQAFGNRLPGMFTHFMTLSGAKGFDQYDPAYSEDGEGLPGGLETAGLQAQGMPMPEQTPAATSEIPIQPPSNPGPMT